MIVSIVPFLHLIPDFPLVKAHLRPTSSHLESVPEHRMGGGIETFADGELATGDGLNSDSSNTDRVEDSATVDPGASDQWRSAALDLGIEVDSPFVLPVDGQVLECVALVKNFGARVGMLVLDGGPERQHKVRDLLAEALDLGYGYSFMDLGPYEREELIDVLDDWGWSGDHAAPDWYGQTEGG